MTCLCNHLGIMFTSHLREANWESHATLSASDTAEDLSCRFIQGCGDLTASRRRAGLAVERLCGVRSCIDWAQEASLGLSRTIFSSPSPRHAVPSTFLFLLFLPPRNPFLDRNNFGGFRTSFIGYLIKSLTIYWLHRPARFFFQVW